MTHRWVVIDTETGGFDPKQHGVCEIAWVEIDEDFNVLGQYSGLVDPEKPISAGAAGVHGITDNEVYFSPTLEEVMTVVNDLPFEHGPIAFIAHNAGFDFKFVGDWFSHDTVLLCTLRLARHVYPDAPDFKMQTLRVWLGLGVNKGDAHSAKGDVDALLLLLKKMSVDSGKSLPELLELAGRPIPVKTITFGKHKGTALRDLPKDYIDWLLMPPKPEGHVAKRYEKFGPDSLDADLKIALEALTQEGSK